MLTGMTGYSEGMQSEDGPGYVAFLDVLGFRGLVGHQAHTDYVSLVAGLIAGPSDETGPNYVLFSDTVVINIFGDSADKLFTLVRASAALFDALLKKGIALRGAIAHGNFERHSTPRGVVIAGKPILEAYDYEQRQDWVGVMLCPSILRRHPTITSQCIRLPEINGQSALAYVNDMRWPLVLRSFPIPFHPTDHPLDTAQYHGVALVPVPKDVTTPADAVTSLERLRDALTTMKTFAPDPSSQRKHDYAFKFLGFVRENWEEKNRQLSPR